VREFVRTYLNIKKLGMVVCTCHPSNGGKLKNRRITVQVGLGKNQDLVSKNNQSKKAGGWCKQ
jgi:hypothetical protein